MKARLGAGVWRKRIRSSRRVGKARATKAAMFGREAAAAAAEGGVSIRLTRATSSPLCLSMLEDVPVAGAEAGPRTVGGAEHGRQTAGGVQRGLQMETPALSAQEVANVAL